MLSEKTVEEVKIKMAKENLTQNKLARLLRCSNGCLSGILNLKKDFPKIEKRIYLWLEDRYLPNFNYEDFIADKNYIKKELERKENLKK